MFQVILPIIHGLERATDPLENEHMLSSLFVLLASQNENLYIIMWSKIKVLCPTIVDFEKGSINAFKESFPHTIVKACFFRLTQNMWRKIQEFGLQSRNQQDPIYCVTNQDATSTGVCYSDRGS